MSASSTKHLIPEESNNDKPNAAKSLNNQTDNSNDKWYSHKFGKNKFMKEKESTPPQVEPLNLDKMRPKIQRYSRSFNNSPIKMKASKQYGRSASSFDKAPRDEFENKNNQEPLQPNSGRQSLNRNRSIQLKNQPLESIDQPILTEDQPLKSNNRPNQSENKSFEPNDHSIQSLIDPLQSTKVPFKTEKKPKEPSNRRSVKLPIFPIQAPSDSKKPPIKTVKEPLQTNYPYPVQSPLFPIEAPSKPKKPPIKTVKEPMQTNLLYPVKFEILPPEPTQTEYLILEPVKPKYRRLIIIDNSPPYESSPYEFSPYESAPYESANPIQTGKKPLKPKSRRPVKFDNLSQNLKISN